MEPLTHDTPAISTPEPPTLRRLFFGDDGLRAGWSFALFLILAATFVFTASAFTRHFHLVPTPAKQTHNALAQSTAFRTAFIPEAFGTFAFLLAALVMARIERRPFARYGLTLRRALPDFLIGLFWGLAFLSALVGALVLTHHLVFDSLLLHGSFAVTSGLQWALLFFFVGLQEEFVTRGYIQYTVARGVSGIARTMDPNLRHSHAVGFWVSAFLFSVCLFMVGHLANPGETAPGILAVGAAGTTFAFSLYRTGSLWWAIGLHTSWDWAQSFLYGVPDSGILIQNHLFATHPTGSPLLSGGTTGPEGSLFVLPTLALICVVIHFTLPRRPYTLTPDQSAIT